MICQSYLRYRINRYIMECKSLLTDAGNRGIPELIDTLWNVNIFIVISTLISPSELIDTLWNVNAIARSAIVLTNQELIDTLWNVNQSIPLINVTGAEN